MPTTRKTSERKREPSSVPQQRTTDTASNDEVQKTYYLVERVGSPAEIVGTTEEPDTSDGRIWSQLLTGMRVSGKRYAYVLRYVESVSFTERYADCVFTDTDGKLVLTSDGLAQRCIVRMGRPSMSDNPEAPSKPSVIVFIGSIEVDQRFSTYGLTSKRTLIESEWSRYVRMSVTHPSGQTITRDVASMDTRQQMSRARFIDQFDLAHENSITDVIRYTRIKLARMVNKGIAITDQGPFTHEGRTYYATRSAVLDESGDVASGFWVHLPTGGRHSWYDITPPAELDPEKVSKGIKLFQRAYIEAPSTPEIPAAVLGSLFTAPVVALNSEYFIATMLYGQSDSGKTWYVRRFDSIQTRTVRQIKDMSSLINRGDQSGSHKGPKYRVTEFGGFSITADDLLTAEDPPGKAHDAKQFVSNLVRSFEEGAAAIGTVDRAANRVTHTETGELHGNIKFTSEVPIPGASTNNRLIVLPRINSSWGTEGNPFDVEISTELSSSESIDCQHHAWSAYAAWLFAHLDSLSDWYERAKRVTRTWGVSVSRTSGRYAAVVAGHYAFAEWCKSRGVDISNEVAIAIAGLEVNARRQSKAVIPFGDLFRQRLYMATADGRISFMGRPIVDPRTNETISPYTHPFVEVITTDKDGVTVLDRTWERPPGVTSPEQLGARRKGRNIVPISDATPHGWMLKPVSVKKPRRGRPKADSNSYNDAEWYVMLDDTQIARLSRDLTSYSRSIDGYEFTPDAIKAWVRDNPIGQIGFIKRVAQSPEGADAGTRQRVTIIRADWLFGLEPTGEEQ